jgi:hypothetical protein
MEPQVRSEEPSGVGGNGVAGRELAERRSRLVDRVQLQNGFRSQFAFGEAIAHEHVDPRIENMDKALDIVPVFLDDVLPQPKNVKWHGVSGKRESIWEDPRSDFIARTRI